MHQREQHEGHEIPPKVGYTLYEGRTVLGWPELTFQRGRPVLRDGEVVAQAGQGRFLATMEGAGEPV